MAELREYATNRFEEICPGGDIEPAFHRIIQDRVTTGKGVAFYAFRRMYKRHLLSFLTNYENNESLRLRADDGYEAIIELLRLPDSRYWVIDPDDVEPQGEVDDTTEMREGQFACSHCARKGKYARNTTHTELQTRSADEPMTIITLCHTCHKSSRFSS